LLIRLRSAFAYLALIAAVLSLLPGMTQLGAVAVALAVSLGWREMRGVPKVVFSVALIALAYALVADRSLIGEGSANVTRLAGLILSVMLLSQVLSRTRDLQRISISLFSGRPVSRYLSLAYGTALVSIPLNFGSVAVIGSLVADRIHKEGDSAATRNATRAVLRGFGVAPMFSPLSISVVLTLTLLPGLASMELLALAVPFSVLLLLFGWFWREPEAPSTETVAEDAASPASWLRFSSVIAGICVGAFLLTSQWGFSYAHGVTLSALAVVLGGRLLELFRAERSPVASMSHVSNELAIVGGSAFIGAVISGVVLGSVSASPEWPAWLWPVLAACVPWVFFAAGLGGVNPIVIGTLAGGILGSIWPESAVLGLGIGMVTGWGVTAFGTPFAANALLMERLTGYRPVDASLRWNLRLSLSALVLASLMAAAATFWLMP